MSPRRNGNEVLEVLQKIANICERMEQTMNAMHALLTEKMSLTQQNYTPIIGYMQPKKDGETQKNMTEGTAKLKLDFDGKHTVYIDLDKRRIALHHCQWPDCRKTFDSVIGTPEKCPHCKKRHWQHGKPLRAIKRERRAQNKLGNGFPNDTT